jgi:hypothetical protein
MALEGMGSIYAFAHFHFALCEICRRRTEDQSKERILIEIRAPDGGPISAKILFCIFKNNKINKIEAVLISRITGTEK